MSVSNEWYSNGAIVSFDGTLTTADVMRHEELLFERLSPKDIHFCVCDFSDVTAVTLTEEGIVVCAETSKDIVNFFPNEIHPMRLAIVTENQQIADFAEIYHSNHMPEVIEMKIFARLEDAKDWAIPQGLTAVSTG